ncbi:hypothetical protein EB118_02075 [bacterium]|nr:hypothetical protein [bacterium]NDC93897.1 hypothetical protein [bacterium]NDD83269.1 hypothetical protein [bacterium]NDG28875.1 hypothetical protein [bacterium]
MAKKTKRRSKKELPSPPKTQKHSFSRFFDPDFEDFRTVLSPSNYSKKSKEMYNDIKKTLALLSKRMSLEMELNDIETRLKQTDKKIEKLYTMMSKKYS